MSLYTTSDKYRYLIEWVIDSLDNVEEIGVWCEMGAKGPVLYDYDGVFSLPKQAIALLKNNGITVPNDFQ